MKTINYLIINSLLACVIFAFNYILYVKLSNRSNDHVRQV